MTTTSTPDGAGVRPDHWWRDRTKLLAAVAAAMMLLGSLLAREVNVAFGGTVVTEVTIFGASGQQISAYLYTPSTATATTPAPAVAMWHGLNNNKGYMENTALELARRGYVVVDADQTGHGSANGTNTDAGCGGPDVLTYLQGLSTVDKTKIGLVGMSQGGFCAATAAALSQPKGYQSIFYMESEPNTPGVIDVTPYKGLRNMAVNVGTWTEMGVMIFVGTGSQAATSPALLPLFGTTDPITPNKIYGSISDGTARVLYTPWEEHALSTDSPAAIGNAISWMRQTIPAPKALDPSNQIWGWKFFGTALALAGAFLFMFVGGSLLLRTRGGRRLVRPVPEYKGLVGVGWWIGAVVTTAIGPLLYLWVWKNMFFTPWLRPSTLWPQTFTNVYMVWTVIAAVIAWVLLWVNHRFFTKPKGATWENYGLVDSGARFSWATVGKSALLVAGVLAPIYLAVSVISSVWHVDFRAWIVMLMPMSLARWVAFASYLLPFATYFFALAITLAGILRWRGGKAPLWQEMLVNSIVLTIGTLVWLVIFYAPLMAGGAQVFGADPVTSTSAGMGGIYYIPMLVLWPMAACLMTFYFRKTGRIYTGATIATALVVWTLAQGGVFGVWPIIG